MKDVPPGATAFAQTARVLLSCRVIGWNLERVMLDELLASARRRRCATESCTFMPLPKNEQVADFRRPRLRAHQH
jgi:predicted enzyme involved in methoxymalonyl-ACP biosynthesis